jgi:predicted enzyme related to lactoylglutathione lyase
MSKETERALRNLDDYAAAGRAVRGLEAVAGCVRKGSGGILLVEEDYHVRGGLERTGRFPAVTSLVDVRDALDDAVDAVIEKALAAGGRVLFTPNDSLAEWGRIALLSRKEEVR